MDPASTTPPRPLRSLDVSMHDGAVIRVRQHGNPDGPRLFVSHGNGLATDGYYPFWHHFLDTHELMVYDQRSHGANPRHDISAHCFDNFVGDLERLLREIPAVFGAKRTSGLFHSLSAIASIAHALEHPWPWEALVLFDPPFCPEPEDSLFEAARVQERVLSERAARRQGHFDHSGELAEKLSLAMGSVGPGWVPGAYEGMARAVLREMPGGGFELACPGAYESQVFAENSTMDLTPRLGELKGPVLFLCADPERPGASGPALINRALHERFGHPYLAPPGLTHMLQLENPELCAGLARQFLDDAPLTQ